MKQIVYPIAPITLIMVLNACSGCPPSNGSAEPATKPLVGAARYKKTSPTDKSSTKPAPEKAHDAGHHR